MILDKIKDVGVLVQAYPVVLIDDGYGGKKPGKGDPVEFYAFVIPVGFSGAGWAIDARLKAQGWADVYRVRLITKPMAGLAPAQRWSRLVFDDRDWSVVDEPRVVRGLRSSRDYVTITVELMGDH